MRFSGFALSTAMPVSELLEFLKVGKIQATEFDALICSSGSEVYYPGTYKEDGGKLLPDPDYSSHIEYRWGLDGLQKTIVKLMNSQDGRGDKADNSSSPIEEDLKSSNAHCISFFIKDFAKVCIVLLQFFMACVSYPTKLRCIRFFLFLSQVENILLYQEKT